jgi:hypothetical protein
LLEIKAAGATAAEEEEPAEVVAVAAAGKEGVGVPMADRLASETVAGMNGEEGVGGGEDRGRRRRAGDATQQRMNTPSPQELLSLCPTSVNLRKITS